MCNVSTIRDEEGTTRAFLFMDFKNSIRKLVGWFCVCQDYNIGRTYQVDWHSGNPDETSYSLGRNEFRPARKGVWYVW
jgi:hypothetical protein